MSKYSLDSYERYPIMTIRPAWTHVPPDNAGYGLVSALPDELTVSPMREMLPGFKPSALLLTPDADGLLNTAWALSLHHLNDCWQNMPVYAWLENPPDARTRAQLLAWHVRAANIPAGLGADLRLRRLTCPPILSSGGAMPLRLWFANHGSSPLYGDFFITLRLAGQSSFDVQLHADPRLFQKMGDIVYNEIVHLPRTPAGAYALLIGVKGWNNAPFALNIDAPQRDGMYPVCEVSIDDRACPEMFHAWDSYYPEGYYPLEDPKEPLPG